MHHAELRLIEIARRYSAVGIQAARAYNHEQAKLQLDLVLAQERLSSAEGTQLSLGALAQLRQLTAAHKQAYSKLVLAASSELTRALSDMPQDVQSERHAGIVSSINWQLNAQAEFYVIRGHWLDAAEAICHLINSRRETCTFGDAGVDFEADEELERFCELMNVVEESHLAEVAALKERLARFSQSAAVLGMGSSA